MIRRAVLPYQVISHTYIPQYIRHVIMRRYIPPIQPCLTRWRIRGRGSHTRGLMRQSQLFPTHVVQVQCINGRGQCCRSYVRVPQRVLALHVYSDVRHTVPVPSYNRSLAQPRTQPCQHGQPCLRLRGHIHPCYVQLLATRLGSDPNQVRAAFCHPLAC